MDDDNQQRLAELQAQNAELKRQVADLQRKQHLLQAVVEGTTDAVFVKDEHGRYLLANAATLNFVGKSAEEVLGHDDTRFFSTETAQPIKERDRRIMESGQTQTDEEVSTAAGQTRTYLSTKGPYRDEQGRVIGLIGFSRDVTERKRSEELLRESEERHRIFAELTSDCVYIYRIQPDGRFLLEWMSESFSRIMGYTVEEFRALSSPLDAIHPDDRATSIETQKRILAGEPTVIERRVITKQGEIRWMRAYSRPQWDPEGHRVVALYGASQDITERKKTELALRASEANYRMLVEQASDGIFIANRHGKFTEVNSCGCQLLGYAREELLELTIPNVHPLEEAARIQATMPRLLAGEIIRDELQFKRKNGSCFPGELSARLLPDGRIQGIVRDITERKRADLTLRESDARLRLLVEASGIGLWDWNLITDEVFFSPEWKRQLGYTDDELPNRHEVWESRLHPDDVALALAAVSDFRTGRRDHYDIEYRLRHKDGSWRWILARADLMHGNNGLPIRMMGCHVDITERKRAEMALRKSEEMLELVLDSIPQGVFWKDRNSVYLGANRVSRRAMGLSEDQAAAGLTDFDLTSLSREQAEFFVRKDSEVMNSDQPQYGFEESMTLSDGSIIWLETNKIPMHDASGAVSGILGTWSNITERKNANIELAYSRERLALMSRQLIAAQESERRHLARELHDEIGQALTGIRLNLNALKQPSLTPKSSALVQDTIDVVDQTLQQARSLALDLRPPLLDEIGLVAALRWCLDRLSQRAGFAPQFVAAPSVSGATSEINTACFRIVQESLTNIARHANARHVRVELRQDDQELELMVRDDGIGFDVVAARNRTAYGECLGLLGMEERAQLIGGQIEIQSAPSQGTTICVQIPIAPMANDKINNDESEPNDE